MVANKSLIQARYTLALLGIAKTSERDAALRLLGGLVGGRPLPGTNRNSQICTMTPSKHSVV
jgi:hypothetical protein